MAAVFVQGEAIASIELGLAVLVAVEPSDAEGDALKLLDRLLKLRVFDDDRGKMNLSLRQISGGLLLVPQFTLAADTRHGSRPSFHTAAPPELARLLFEHLVSTARSRHSPVESGRFGSKMDVHLVNTGPATFWLESAE